MDFASIMSHPMVREGLLWLGLGLGVGIVAKIVIPGSENMGWIRTIIVGWIGVFAGNYIAPRIFDWPTYSAFSMQGIGIGIAGAILFVVINRIVTTS
jgi:uncharacterized membrane protein YeaQ/YmgE (transglycosylase-associated protein family)